MPGQSHPRLEDVSQVKAILQDNEFQRFCEVHYGDPALTQSEPCMMCIGV